MSLPQQTPAKAAAPKRRLRRSPGWRPRQHGAWAMLVVPFLAGVIRSDGALLHIPLGIFWLCAYLAFQALGLWTKSHFRARMRPPVLGYGALAAVTGLPIAILRPDLLWWAPGFVLCLAVSLWYSWRRDERSLVNDIITIVAAGLFGLVTYQAGYSPGGTIPAGWLAMAAISAVLVAYFVGTAFYVKTVIRERGNRAWTVASVGYHAAVTAVLAGISLLPTLPPGLHHRPLYALTGLFVILTARAGIIAGRVVRPLYVGLGEIVVCILLLGIVAGWR